MNSKTYLEGYHLTLENSESLFKIAEISARECKYGIACSLNILSSEEAIKAVYFLLKHFKPNANIECFEDIFKFHKTKHNELKNLIKQSKIYIEEMSKMYKLFLKTEEITKILPPESQERIKTEFEDIHLIGNRILKIHANNYELDSALNWLDNANDDKNNGLYVGIKEFKLISPNKFTLEKYMKERLFCRSIIDYVIEIERVKKDFDAFKQNLR